MDRGVRALWAVGILVGGVALATLFRHPPQDSPPVGGRGDPPLLRQRNRPHANESATPIQRPTARIEARAAVPHPLDMTGPPTTTPIPLDFGDPPPRLSPSYSPPSDRQMPARRSSARATARPGGRRGPSLPTHQIVDGDTLEALAARYLGDARHWTDIYEANRDRLPSADLLPIGVPLRIPLRP